MKRLLDSSHDFDEWLAENSQYDILYNINEQRPLNYPCVLFSYRMNDLYSVKSLIVYDFIYLSNFTNNN